VGRSSEVVAMFGRIAGRYDLLNHVLSFGLDVRWRNRLAQTVAQLRPLRVVDLATGTGDVLVAMLRYGDSVGKVVGVDASVEMLKLCENKLLRRGLRQRVELVCADATRTGFADESFDAVTMAFGLRNMPDVREALREIHRIVRPGGTALILEFSKPAQKALVRWWYRLYLRHIIPSLGRIISGDGGAYRYLGWTIENFYSAEQLCGLMRKIGFQKITCEPMTLGMVHLHVAIK